MVRNVNLSWPVIGNIVFIVTYHCRRRNTSLNTHTGIGASRGTAPHPQPSLGLHGAECGLPPCPVPPRPGHYHLLPLGTICKILGNHVLVMKVFGLMINLFGVCKIYKWHHTLSAWIFLGLRWTSGINKVVVSLSRFWINIYAWIWG